MPELAIRPARLLTQNSELRAEGIYNWSLPAWAGRMADGRTYNTCPSAGVCRQACYARNGSYRFRNVLDRHERNLAYVLDDLHGWTRQMIAEVQGMCARAARRQPRRRVAIRIHDSGDFFDRPYLAAWLEVMAECPDARFYAYTKEVPLFRELVEPNPPANFRWVYSYGGVHDDLLNPERDRVADVFPDVESLEAAGYADQSASDLLAVDGPPLVGIPANNIPHYRKRQNGRTFRQWQQETNEQRARARANAHRYE